MEQHLLVFLNNFPIVQPQQWGTLVTDNIEKDYPLNINITIGLIALANDKGGLCNSIAITIVNNNLRIQARQTNTLEIQKTDINWYALSI